MGTGLTGGTRTILELANRLAKRNHDVSIVTLEDSSASKWIDLQARTIAVPGFIFREALIKVLERCPGPPLPPLVRMCELAKAIPECDVCVATWCLTAHSVYMSGMGSPFYHMQHYEPLLFKNPLESRFAATSYMLPLNKIANSIWLRKMILEKHGIDCPVVNPGIDHSVFKPMEVNGPSDKKRIVCFAKNAPMKGFQDAVAAMRAVTKERRDIEFIAYGAKRLPVDTGIPYRFIKSPSDRELAMLYSSADVVMCPSWYESFPLPPLEGMACGVPVVTTSIGTEDYAINEENCLVVPPRNPAAMADAILRLLTDDSLRERFRIKGPVTAKRFTWEKTTDAVERIFRSRVNQIEN
jgi:glycosyltransferase involved in cell wall biosynthesis